MACRWGGREIQILAAADGKTPDAETFKEHLDCFESYFTPAHFELRSKALQWYRKDGLRRAKATA